MLCQLSYTHHRRRHFCSDIRLRPRGAPERIRTPDPRLRRPLLYPPELLAPKQWSGRADLNGRPPAPKAGALPGCATPRHLIGDESLARATGTSLRSHAERFPERPHGAGAMAHPGLVGRRGGREGHADLIGDEDRIVPEAASALGRQGDPPLDDPLGRILAAARPRQHHGAAEAGPTV